MLAKMWKKVLLGICIIACLFNLMSKLVNRHSLESNLKRANDGNTVFDVIKKDESSENLNTVENENSDINQTENTNTENTNTEVSGNSNNTQEQNTSNTSENKEKIDITNIFKTDEYKENTNKVFKYTDYTIVF